MLFSKNEGPRSGWLEFFERFGNFTVKDVSRSGSPVIEKGDETLQSMEQDRNISCREVSKALNLHKVTLVSFEKGGPKQKFEFGLSAMLRRVSDSVGREFSAMNCCNLTIF